MVMVNFFNTILLLITFTDSFLPSVAKNCPTLVLTNGKIRSSFRGRNVRFNCNRGYQLVGVKYATCVNGKWDADTPICVKYGCLAPSTIHVNGQFIESYRGAVVKIICHPGYSLVGSPSVYCDGYWWNETFPVCKVTTQNPALSCDFENPDLCGWSQDPMHDFDWKRVQSTVLPGKIAREPIFDHTFGENGSGHFMQMGGFKANLENATARLYSPVYPLNYSINSCFKFWYYLQGSNTGSLKIYVKPERIELYNLIPFFWVNEEPGKSWTEGFFSLKPTNSPFQIVVEGIKASGHVNDTGFDDVKLAFGAECIVPEETTTSSTEFSTSVFSTDEAISFSTSSSGSCKNKCNQFLEKESCQCNSTCLKNGNCCSDYIEMCNLLVSSSTTPVTVSTTRKLSKITFTTQSTSPTPKIVGKIHIPSYVVPPPREANNGSDYNPIVPMSPKNVTSTNKDLERKLEKDNGVLKPKSNPENSEKNKNKFTQWKIPIFEPPNIKFPKHSVNKMETQKETESKQKGISSKVATEKDFLKAKVDVIKIFGEQNVTVAKKSHTTISTVVVSTTVSSPKLSRLNFTKLEKVSIPALPIEHGLYKGKSKESSGKEPPQAIKINKQDQSRKTTLKGMLEIGGGALFLLVLIFLGIFWYQRSKNRKSERENMIEDSDVRYLTSDEVLDFTLAQPADDDL